MDSSEVVVNMYDDGRVHSIYDNYHYDIPPDLDPARVKLPPEGVRDLVGRLSSHYESFEIKQPELIVYQYQRSGREVI